MKKSIGLKKLALKKETIAALDQLNQSQVQGGGSVASACYSCMSQCLCNGGGQTAPGRPCCQRPGIM
ncbi:class I lanthipeptide [Taibaiella chishuiensis]|uniref:class I lanthipeptide n=1 Tax=Taibaiella chishuiensis TaxID=1434707 RepID=UPI0015E66284|nr:class I lanthipeptide [Taibaiella chishuiensis]